MNAPRSAGEETERLINKAETDARPFYKKAEEQQGAIWNDRIAEGLQHPDIKKGIAEGVNIQSTRNAMTGQPFNPTDAAIVGFDKAGDPIISGVPNFKTLQTAKIGLDSMIKAETDITGKMTDRGAALVGLKNRLNEQIAAFRPDYATANKLFSDPMRIKDAVALGQKMPTSGRAVDNTRVFERLNQPEQQGVRIGVADRLREQLERNGRLPDYLTQKSIKGQAEIEALAPYGPNSLKDFLAREETMRTTSRKALGGSSTAENAADIADTPAAASVFGIGKNLMTGNWMGAAKDAAERLAAIGKGENEAQRVAITKALLMRDPKEFEKLVDQLKDYELRRRGVNPFYGQQNRPPRYREGE